MVMTPSPRPLLGCLSLLHRKARPVPPIGLGLGALLWKASDLALITREACGHHAEACFNACFREKGAGCKAPSAQEFITSEIEDLQEGRAMQGEPLNVAATQDTNGKLRFCINIQGLNRAASQEHFWSSSVGRCGGRPHNYVCMPFDLPGVAALL